MSKKITKSLKKMYFLLHKKNTETFHVLLRMKALNEKKSFSPEIILDGILYCGAHQILEDFEVKPLYRDESVIKGIVVQINEETIQVQLLDEEKVLIFKHKGFEPEGSKFEVYYLQEG